MKEKIETKKSEQLLLAEIKIEKQKQIIIGLKKELKELKEILNDPEQLANLL